MVVGLSDIQVILALLGILLFAVLGIAVFFVALYFVVRNAVIAALRKHDSEKIPAQMP